MIDQSNPSAISKSVRGMTNLKHVFHSYSLPLLRIIQGCRYEIHFPFLSAPDVLRLPTVVIIKN